MSISIVRPWRPEPLQVRDSALLAEAIQAHETRLADTADTRALVLTRLVLKVLGRSVDRMTYLPKHREPVAIVDRVQFRGEAENPYDLKGGWLCVRTERSGWREVRSLEQLGQIARQEPLALVEAVWP